MPNALAIAFVGIALGKETPTCSSLNDRDCVTICLPSLGVLIPASKFLLFLYCRAVSQYNAANILATDHRNDLLVNGFGLFASLLSRYCWWLDPAGAIVVSLIILRSWVWTAYGKGEHAQHYRGEIRKVSNGNQTLTMPMFVGVHD